MINTSQNHIDGIPNKTHFETYLLETKPGQPNNTTGILPAFLSVKWSRRTANITEFSIDISRPTKIHFSIKSWQFILYLNALLSKIINEGTQNEFKVIPTMQSTQSEQECQTESIGQNKEFTKFKKFYKQLFYLTTFNFNCAQLVLALTTKNSMNVIFGCEKINSRLAVKNRPERITNSLFLECLTLSVINGDSSRLLLNPWSVSTELNLFWEPWQEMDSNAQVAVAVDTDCLRFDIGSEHLHSLETIMEEYQDFMNTLNVDSNNSTCDSDRVVISSRCSISQRSLNDQHYKDDLRAGVFQFVDANIMGGAYDDLPLPYQVIFANQPQTAMSWRYPQPRTLTKVRVFPVPFKVSFETRLKNHKFQSERNPFLTTGSVVLIVSLQNVNWNFVYTFILACYKSQ